MLRNLGYVRETIFRARDGRHAVGGARLTSRSGSSEAHGPGLQRHPRKFLAPTSSTATALSSHLTAGAAGRHGFATAGIPDCSVLSVASPSLAGAHAAHVASTRRLRNVCGRDLHNRAHLTSLQVCRAAKPSPSRLCQSIHPADRTVCSFDHRKTRMTRASSLLVGLSILEQLRATSGARITLLPPHLA